MPTANGIFYNLYQKGSKRDLNVVLIHGAAGMHLFWPSEIRRIPGFQVYAIDLPGHGRSGESGKQSITQYTQSVIEWMNALGLASCVFIGHSMGGAIVQSLALDYPERVLGLGLVGTGARLRVHPDILQSAANLETYPQAIELLAKMVFHPPNQQKFFQVAKYMLQVPAQVVLGDLIACNTFDVMDRLGEIYQPTLVICGEADLLTPVRYSQYLAEKLPSAKLHVIPQAGHMVMMMQPRTVARLLESFLVQDQETFSGSGKVR